MRFSHLAALLRMQISGYFHHGLCSAGEITYLHSKEARFFKVVFCSAAGQEPFDVAIIRSLHLTF